MRTGPQPHEVRELVIRTCMQLGSAAPSREAGPLEETLLIEGGKLVARTYRMDGLMAMWLVEVGIVQFYDADGAMLRTVNLFQELEPVRMAA